MAKFFTEKIIKKTGISNGVENQFRSLLFKYGYKYFNPTENQNIHEHWDVCMIDDTKTPVTYNKIDIKGIKQNHSENKIWIELINVRGETGWLYSKELNTLAFERDNCFDLISREDLVQVVESGIKMMDEQLKKEFEIDQIIIFCDKTDLKNYQRYRRSGRMDIIITVPYDDIKNLVYLKLDK